MTDRDERQLVDDASRGDLNAVEALVVGHLPGLTAYVRRVGGDLPREKESASDLVQSVCREVLGALQEGRFEYRGEAEFRAWLYEATLFKVRNRRRHWRADRRDVRKERGGGGGDDSTDVGADRFAGGGPSPSGDAAAQEELAAARALLGQLPERYRRVIELVRLEGLSHEEAAERLGITREASRMLLSRALARLATLAEREE